MASDQHEQIDRIKAKAALLCEKYNTLKSSYSAARQQINELKAQLVAKEGEIQQLQLKADYLAIASAVRLKDGDLDTARATIANLLREVDLCISDLIE